jgi:hypothetical protein
LLKNADEWSIFGDFIIIEKNGKQRKLPRKLFELYVESIIQKTHPNFSLTS